MAGVKTTSMIELYPKRIFAMIPEKYILESGECMIEFKATITLGRNSDLVPSMIITVKDANGKTMSGIQFIAELKEQDAADGNMAGIT